MAHLNEAAECFMSNSIHYLLCSGTKIEILILNLVLRMVLHSAKFPVPMLRFHCDLVFFQNWRQQKGLCTHSDPTHHQLTKLPIPIDALWDRNTGKFSLSLSQPCYLMQPSATSTSVYVVNYNHKNPTEKNGPSSIKQGGGIRDKKNEELRAYFKTLEKKKKTNTHKTTNFNTEKQLIWNTFICHTRDRQSQNSAYVSITIHITVTWEKHEKRPVSEKCSFKSTHEFEE